MISADDFRSGTTFKIDNATYQVIEFQYVRSGRGAAFVCTEIRNVTTRAVTERTSCPAEKFPAARIDRVETQYLYADNDIYSFMNAETYGQISLNKDPIDGALEFVKENETVKVVFYNGNMFSVKPPFFMELEVMETEPGFVDNMATDAQRLAAIGTGVQISMSLFIGIGDHVKINTHAGEYLNRTQN